MAKLKLATLDSGGVIIDPIQIMNRLFLYFEKSSYRQSDLYQGKIASFRYLKERHGHDFPKFKEGILQQLEKMYEAYFDDVVITVEAKLVKQNLVEIIIQGSMVHEGTTMHLNKSLTHSVDVYFEDD